MENNKEVTDICVVNIKEDIERCKELIKDKHKEWIGLTNQKAIANVLNDYENLQNNVKKLNELSSNNERLIEKLNSGETFTFNQIGFIEKNFILKQKIKDKIEELRKEHKKIEEISDFIIADTIQPKIEILEELLKENEDK